jgi:hypothetical protein
MRGEQVQRHKARVEIDQQLKDGYSPDEVSKWLKNTYKHRMYWISAPTLNDYRKNFLQLDEEELKRKRRILLETGNTREANQIERHLTTQEVIDSNNELIKIKEEAKKEIVTVLDNFKYIQDTVKTRINEVINRANDPNMARQVTRNEELLERYLARLESMSVQFQKIMDKIEEKEIKKKPVEVSLTTQKIEQYSDIYKNILQKVVTKFDPSLMGEVMETIQEEFAKVGGTSQTTTTISITNASNLRSPISIITNPQEITENQDAKVIDVQKQNDNDEESND